MALKIYLVILVLRTTYVTGDCGYPGQPAGGYFRPAKDRYAQDESVLYECYRGSLLLGSQRSVCLSSGAWSGSDVVCAPQLSSVLVSSEDSFLLDRNRATCNVINSTRIFFHLMQVTVQALMIVTSEEDLRTIHVKIGTTGSTNSIRTTIGPWGYTIIPCSEDICRSLSLLTFGFGENAHVCEVIFYGWQGASQCGFPPIPLHGESNGDFNEQEYSCEPGYHIVGQKTIRCTDGVWFGEKPFCQSNVDTSTIAHHESENKITSSDTTLTGLEMKRFWKILPGLVLSSATTVLFIVTIIWAWRLPAPPRVERKQPLTICESMEPTCITQPTNATFTEPYYAELI